MEFTANDDVPGSVANTAWQTFLVLRPELDEHDRLQQGLEQHLREQYETGVHGRAELLMRALMYLQKLSQTR